MSHIARIAPPQFGTADDPPPISIAEYQERLVATVERMVQAGLDVLFVYADREHLANMAYLTGFEPRFEEAALLLDARGQRTLLVGNECMGYLPPTELGCEVVLFQEFSLLGQSRGRSAPLREILAERGVGRGVRVGCVGWKYFEGCLIDQPAQAMDIPAYIVDLLRDLCGDPQRVVNATGLFMNPRDGLRIRNSADQIAQFGYAAVRTSESVLAAIKHIAPGVTERDLEPYLESGGLPLSCHRMVGFGAKAQRGLASPSGNRAHLGDPFTACIGVWGSLTSRAGAVAHGPEDLPPDLREFYPRFVAGYYDVVVAWYESVRVGATGGEVYAAVEARRDAALFDLALNPGHYVHLEEWVHSPFEAGGQSVVPSGAALQMDIIPVSRGPFCTSNAEDTLSVANEALCAELAARHPGCWGRIQARRRFMVEQLGIRLHPSVLPLGNTPGWLAPYALAWDQAMVAR